MSIGQTSYDLKMQAAIAGMIADNGDHHCETAIVEESDGIGFGLGVVVGDVIDGYNSLGKGAKIPESDNDTFLGVTVFKHKENSYPYADGGNKLAQNEAASIMRKGRIWVQTDGTVAVDSDVYVTTAGKFTTTSSSNLAVPTGVLRRIESDLGLAVLEINMP